MRILRPFRVEEKRWSCLCKSFTYNSGAAVISWRATCLQISLVKTVLERKVKYDFFTGLTRKNKRDIFPQLGPVFNKKSQQTSR